jgi:hypothetical protein
MKGTGPGPRGRGSAPTGDGKRWLNGWHLTCEAELAAASSVWEVTGLAVPAR